MNERILKKMNQLVQAEATFAVATIVRTEGSSPRDVGTKMIVLPDGSTFGTLGGDCAEADVVQEALAALREGQPRFVTLTLTEEEKGGVGMRCGGTIDVSIEVFKPSPKLVIVGSGGIAVQVARLGVNTGFAVTVIDPWAKEDRFPDTVEVIPEFVDTGLAKVSLTPRTFVVIVTRHKYDEPALKAVLGSKAAYIGMVGSPNRVTSIYRTLLQQGVPKEQLLKVHAPIGLDLGAEAPEEIAVSIIAEVIAAYRGGTGMPLKLRDIDLTTTLELKPEG